MKYGKETPQYLETQLINTSDKYNVEEWARKFKVSPEGLYNAIKKVGSNVKELEKFYANRNKL